MISFDDVAADTLVIIDDELPEHLDVVKKLPAEGSRRTITSLHIPEYHEIAPAKQGSWQQPQGLIRSAEVHLSGADYDADSDDEAFVIALNNGEINKHHSVAEWISQRLIFRDAAGKTTSRKTKKSKRQDVGGASDTAAKDDVGRIRLEHVEQAFQLLEDEAYIHKTIKETNRMERDLTHRSQAAVTGLHDVCSRYARLHDDTHHSTHESGSLMPLAHAIADVTIAKVRDRHKLASAAPAVDDELRFSDVEHLPGMQREFFEYWMAKRALEGGPLLRCYETVSDLKHDVALRVIGAAQIEPLPKTHRRSECSSDEEDEENMTQERFASLLAKRLSQVRSRARDIESNARALVRMRRLRQQIERLRLLVDLTRKREKLKRERAKAMLYLVQTTMNDGVQTPAKRARSAGADGSGKDRISAASIFGPPRTRAVSTPAAPPRVVYKAASHPVVASNIRELFAAVTSHKPASPADDSKSCAVQ